MFLYLQVFQEHSSFSNFMFSFSPLNILPVISFLFSYGSLLSLSYIFSAKCAKLKFLPFFRFCSSTLLDLPLFMYSYSLSYHGPILLTTRLPITISLCSHLYSAPYALHHLHAGCYFDKYTLPTHYLPLQCLWNVDHAAQYTTFTCFQSSFLEPFILCSTRIL